MPKLVEKTARDGCSIFVFDGLHMASTVSPRAEAAKWLASAGSQIGKAETVFLLGLGCGYHARELGAKYPHTKIVAIERHGEIADWFLRDGKTPENIRVLRVEEPEMNSSYRGFVLELTSPYTILENPYSLRADKDYYAAVRSFLVARRPIELSRHAEWRPEQATLLQALSQAADRSVPEEKELNIKDVLSVLAEKKEEFQISDKIWLTLGELIR